LFIQTFNMCRFSATQPSQQVEEGLADGFNWFDAIDEICTEEDEDQLLVEHEQLEPQPAGGGSRTSLVKFSRLEQALSVAPAATGNLLDVWCQQIGGEVSHGGPTSWLVEPAGAAVQQAPQAAPVLYQAIKPEVLEQVAAVQAYAGPASMSSGSVDDEQFSCDAEQPMASGANETQHKHNNNAAGKHTATAKHTKVLKVGAVRRSVQHGPSSALFVSLCCEFCVWLYWLHSAG
jgi:hypothetical protein